MKCNSNNMLENVLRRAPLLLSCHPVVSDDWAAGSFQERQSGLMDSVSGLTFQPLLHMQPGV